LLYQYFRGSGCSDGMQAMSHNLLLRYPCQNINVEMIKFLDFNRTAILFMVLGVLSFNCKRIIAFSMQIPVIVRSLMVRVARKLFL